MPQTDDLKVVARDTLVGGLSRLARKVTYWYQAGKRRGPPKASADVSLAVRKSRELQTTFDYFPQ